MLFISSPLEYPKTGHTPTDLFLFIFIFILIEVDKTGTSGKQKKKKKIQDSSYGDIFRNTGDTSEWNCQQSQQTEYSIQFNSPEGKKKSNHRFTSPSPVHKRILDLFFRFSRISSILIQIYSSSFLLRSSGISQNRKNLFFFQLSLVCSPKIRIFPITCIDFRFRNRKRFPSLISFAGIFL